MLPRSDSPRGADKASNPLSRDTTAQLVDPLAEAVDELRRRPDFPAFIARELERAASADEAGHVSAAQLDDLVDIPREQWPEFASAHIASCAQCEAELVFFKGLSPYTARVRKAIERLEAEMTGRAEVTVETALEIPARFEKSAAAVRTMSPDPDFDKKERESARARGHGARSAQSLEEAFDPFEPLRA